MTNPALQSASLQVMAEQIADAYLQSLPPDYCSRYSELGDSGVIETLFKAKRLGMTDTAACEAAGISLRTFQRWQKDAEQHPEGPKGVFVAHLKAERRRGQIACLERIQRHAEKEWTADAWQLERMDPEQFALRKDTDANIPKVIVQIGVKDGDVQVQIAPSPPTFAPDALLQGAGSD